MNQQAAKTFIASHARPVDLVVYRCFFEQGNRQQVVDEML